MSKTETIQIWALYKSWGGFTWASPYHWRKRKEKWNERERESTVKSRAKANPARAQNSYPSDFPISPRVSSCLFFAWRRFSVKSRKNEHVAMMGNLGESRLVSRGGLSNQFVSCLLYVTLIRAAEQHRQKTCFAYSISSLGIGNLCFEAVDSVEHWFSVIFYWATCHFASRSTNETVPL